MNIYNESIILSDMYQAPKLFLGFSLSNISFLNIFDGQHPLTLRSVLCGKGIAMLFSHIIKYEYNERYILD